MDKLILELHEELIAKEQKINMLNEAIDLQRTQMVAYQERFRVLQDKINKAIEYIKFNLDKNEELIEYYNWDGNFNKLLEILKGE